MGVAGGDRGGDAVGRGMLVQGMADRDHRRLVAAAHARRPHDPHAIAEPVAQIAEQLRRAPASAQLRLSHTRTVSGGGGASSSMTMSKWA